MTSVLSSENPYSAAVKITVIIVLGYVGVQLIKIFSGSN